MGGNQCADLLRSHTLLLFICSESVCRRGVDGQNQTLEALRARNVSAILHDLRCDTGDND